MKFDAGSLTLRFASRDELERFHQDLTDLVRLAVLADAVKGEAAATGVAHAKDAMRRFATATRALNALRGQLRDDE